MHEPSSQAFRLLFEFKHFNLSIEIMFKTHEARRKPVRTCKPRSWSEERPRGHVPAHSGFERMGSSCGARDV
jgi:hypothetical protein